MLLALVATPIIPGAFAQETARFELFGETWLDLNMNGIRDEDEPLLDSVEIWANEIGSEPTDRSRSGLNGRYTKWRTAPGIVEIFAMAPGLNNGDGQRGVLLAPSRLAAFREEPTRVDLGLFEAPKPHDERFFPETGRRIRDNPVWDYYSANGGLTEFGRPLSDPFIFTCCWMQIFEYGALNVSRPYLGVARMNVLDGDVLGIDVLDDAIRVPPYDASIPAQAGFPPAPACDGGPGGFIGQTVGYGPVGLTSAFLDEYLRVHVPEDIDLFRAYCQDGLERWGLPTSQAVASPNGDGGIMQRFQRGVMWFRADCACIRRVPYGETLRRAFRGDDIGQPELRTAAVFGLFAPALLRSEPSVHANTAVGILATGGPTH